MLYDRLGDTLARAASAASDLDLSSEDGARQLRQLALLLDRVAAMWSAGLFEAMEEELEAMEGTVADLVPRFAAAGQRTSWADPVTGTERPADPLARYRELVIALGGAVAALRAARTEEWAADARVALRRGLLAAASAQGRLVDAAWAIT